MRPLLVAYIAQRILFYQSRDAEELRAINAKTAQLQTELWSAVKGPALAQPTAPSTRWRSRG